MAHGFQHRARGPELMDLQDSDERLLFRTLSQFEWINLLFSRSRSILKESILARGASSISVLDVGAGGGDIMRWLVRQCRRRNINCRIVCLDYDPRVVAFAKKRCAGYREIEVRLGNILNATQHEQFDYVYCNNFLHHFEDAKIPALLDSMSKMATHSLIVNDIHRSKAAYLGYSLFSAFFLHRSFARFDGKLSIRKGFKVDDLVKYASQMARSAGSKVQIKQLNPSRVVLQTAGQAKGFE